MGREEALDISKVTSMRVGSSCVNCLMTRRSVRRGRRVGDLSDLLRTVLISRVHVH